MEREQSGRTVIRLVFLPRMSCQVSARLAGLLPKASSQGVRVMLEASQRYFHRAADLFDLDPKLRSILLTPNRIVKAELAFEGADGDDPPPHRLSRTAQQPSGSLQGRPALSPRDGRGPRRSPGEPHDLEDRRRRRPVRRREGRHRLRPERDGSDRREQHDASVRHADKGRDRADTRHSGSRHEHGRVRDGLDHGRVLEVRGILTRGRHREAAAPLRIRGSRGSDGARRRARRRRRPGGRGAQAGGDHGRHPGLRQRRELRRADSGRLGGPDRRGRRSSRWGRPRRGAGRFGARGMDARAPHREGLRRGRGDRPLLPS